jgi:hypothetical protein
MRIISDIFAGLVIRRGFGKLVAATLQVSYPIWGAVGFSVVQVGKNAYMKMVSFDYSYFWFPRLS